jgi:hypothetical protein
MSVDVVSHQPQIKMFRVISVKPVVGRRLLFPVFTHHCGDKLVVYPA